jgi:hypothetical protein
MACILVAITAYLLAVLILSPYLEPDDIPTLYTLIALVLLLLSFGAVIVTPIFGWRAWRDYRRAHGHFTKKERAVQIREAREASARAEHAAAYANGWEHGRQLAAGLRAGQALPALSVWGLVLHEGEQAHLDVPVYYARFYGGDGSYEHVSGMFLGGPAFVIGGLAATAVGNAVRRSRAQAEAMQCWREHQLVRVVATNLRLICQANGTWLSFYFSAATAFYPEPRSYSMIFEFPDTSPLLLSGSNVPLLAVYATWRLHGAEAIASHPALATLTV